MRPDIFFFFFFLFFFFFPSLLPKCSLFLAADKCADFHGLIVISLSSFLPFPFLPLLVSFFEPRTMTMTSDEAS